MKIKKRTVRRIKKNKYGYRAIKSRGGRRQQTSRLKPVIDHEFQKYNSKYPNSEYIQQLTTLIELFGNNQKYAQQLFSKSNYTDDKIVKIILENSSITMKDITKLQNFITHSLAIVVGGAAAPAASEDENICAICLSPLTEGVLVEGCTGHHQFHRDCLKAWVDQQKSTCPTCRGIINPNLVQRLRNLPTTRFHEFISRFIHIHYLPIETLIGLFVLTVSIMSHLILNTEIGNRYYFIFILWWIANLLSSAILLRISY